MGYNIGDTVHIFPTEELTLFLKWNHFEAGRDEGMWRRADKKCKVIDYRTEDTTVSYELSCKGYTTTRWRDERVLLSVPNTEKLFSKQTKHFIKLA